MKVTSISLRIFTLVLLLEIYHVCADKKQKLGNLKKIFSSNNYKNIEEYMENSYNEIYDEPTIKIGDENEELVTNFIINLLKN